MPAIMYHFVGVDEKLKGITLEDFRKQLDVCERLQAREEVVLTFDHGTIDHIEIVAPELETRGLRGHFFILTMIPEEHRVPPIDQQRFLEATYRLELAELLCTALDIAYTPHVAADYLAEYTFYSLEERYLRFLRDKVVSEDAYARVIGEMFRRAFGDEEEFCSRHYLGWGHIYELHQRGHVIGSHSHIHYGDVKDYEQSMKLIQRAINERPYCISYPNGWVRTSEDELIRLGVRTAYISSENGASAFRAARIDCNQFKLVEFI